MQEQALVETEWKLHAESSAALSAQRSAFAKAEEARKCCEKVYDAEKHLKIVLIAANKISEDAKIAK